MPGEVAQSAIAFNTVKYVGDENVAGRIEAGVVGMQKLPRNPTLAFLFRTQLHAVLEHLRPPLGVFENRLEDACDVVLAPRVAVLGVDTEGEPLGLALPALPNIDLNATETGLLRGCPSLLHR